MTTSSRVGRKTAERVDQIDWDKVYHDLLPQVFRYFAYRVGNRQIAEDLTANTFERAWAKRRRYRRDLGAFRNWVFGIALNVVRQHYRSQREDLELTADSGASHGRQPEHLLHEQENYERLMALMAMLPERERELVALKYGAGMTNRAIAQATGLSESNTGTILHRVVAKLRENWEADNE